MTLGIGILGWSPEQFWSCSLPELLAAWRGYQEREQRDDFRAGMIIAMIANANRDAQKKPEPFAPEDFFPSLKDHSREQQQEEEWKTLQADGDFAVFHDMTDGGEDSDG